MSEANSISISAAAHAEGLAEYVESGTALAKEVGNRGPIRFDAHGRLHQDILEAYWTHGFYVFEGLVDGQEINALRADMATLIDRAPVGQHAKLDSHGQPAFGQQFKRKPYTFIKPLSDPWGGTDVLGGRHPTQMLQPQPAQDAPSEVLYLMNGMCQTMESGLRLYGHPHILTIAEGINGADFVPYNDATFIKQPGLGGSVSWHQDGVTHWDSPNWDEGIHGFNFQVQLYKCTARNCLWVIPGTHKQGRLNIKALVAANGDSEQLPGALPLLCEPGDVTVANRQILHCSFANTSPDLRISLTFGFHRRASVLGAKGALSQKEDETYDESRIFERSAVIAVAIDARAQYYPDELRFCYQPFMGLEEQYRFTDEIYEQVIKDYNLKDLSI